MMLENLTTVTYMIEYFRDETKDYFPEPGIMICLEFAITEYAEALDAHLRTHPGIPRNNSRNISVEDELMDALLMVGSAYIQIPGQINLESYPTFRQYKGPENFIISRLHALTAIYQTPVDDKDFKTSLAILMIELMIFVPDWQSRLGRRMRALDKKHKPVGVPSTTPVM